MVKILYIIMHFQLGVISYSFFSPTAISIKFYIKMIFNQFLFSSSLFYENFIFQIAQPLQFQVLLLGTKLLKVHSAFT